MVLVNPVVRVKIAGHFISTTSKRLQKTDVEVSIAIGKVCARTVLPNSIAKH